MRRLILLLLFVSAAPVSAAEVARAGQYVLHSDFWQSLHQTLLSSRVRKEVPEAWQPPVEAYRKAFAMRAAYHDGEIIKISDTLMTIADDADVTGIREDIAAALRAAAPLYRKERWARDDRAARFWIAYATPMLREGAGDISRELARLYERPWPSGTIRIDVTPFAGPNGAYTTDAVPHIVVAAPDPGYQGFHALEMMMHESSHLSVGPNSPTVGRVIAAAAKKLGVETPPFLWHAILFRTSGEVTRRWLADRRVKYETIADDVIREAWAPFKEPLDRHWMAYIDGKMTRDAAIEAIVKDVAAAKAGAP